MTRALLGAGKTHLLYHVFDKCGEAGFLPFYFSAEDLFGGIFKVDAETRTPGKLSEIASTKVNAIVNALEGGDERTLRRLMNPRDRVDLEFMTQSVVDRFCKCDVGELKLVLLVDELEQRYRPLQEAVRTGERSPLREWLERKDSLKFLALAPSGTCEMGEADQTRCRRIVIPAVDVEH